MTQIFTQDCSPLMRGLVGMDRVLRTLEGSLQSLEGVVDNYPPYNLERQDENHWRVRMAVAGFAPEELDVQVNDRKLEISGRKKVDSKAQPLKYLHRGLAERDFVRSLELCDGMVVKRADLVHGVLTVELELELPEERKPRTIEISAA